MSHGARHIIICVRGRVQGVFFRVLTKKKADMLEIVGFVRNENDGSVYIEAEAPEKKLRQFVEWCRKGPLFSRVDAVEITPGQGTQRTSFEII